MLFYMFLYVFRGIYWVFHTKIHLLGISIVKKPKMAVMRKEMTEYADFIWKVEKVCIAKI